MGGGKPPVPENLKDILTSTDYCPAYTSSFTYVRYASYAVATVDYLRPFRLVDYVLVIAFSPGSLRTFFYDKIISLLYSITIKSLLLLIFIRRSFPSLKT